MPNCAARILTLTPMPQRGFELTSVELHQAGTFRTLSYGAAAEQLVSKLRAENFANNVQIFQELGS